MPPSVPERVTLCDMRACKSWLNIKQITVINLAITHTAGSVLDSDHWTLGIKPFCRNCQLPGKDYSFSLVAQQHSFRSWEVWSTQQDIISNLVSHLPAYQPA